MKCDASVLCNRCRGYGLSCVTTGSTDRRKPPAPGSEVREFVTRNTYGVKEKWRVGRQDHGWAVNTPRAVSNPDPAVAAPTRWVGRATQVFDRRTGQPKEPLLPVYDIPEPQRAGVHIKPPTGPPYRVASGSNHSTRLISQTPALNQGKTLREILMEESQSPTH